MFMNKHNEEESASGSQRPAPEPSGSRGMPSPISDVRAQQERIWVSPNFQQVVGMNKVYDVMGRAEREIDEIVRIEILRDQVLGWFLDHAKTLASERHAGFVVLMIAVQYIEGNQQYREGTDSLHHSEDFFKRGMMRTFKDAGSEQCNEENYGWFYRKVRCGLFHDGMTREGVQISGAFSEAIHFNDMNGQRSVKVNPARLLEIVREDFNNYTDELLKEARGGAKADLLVNFKKHLGI